MSEEVEELNFGPMHFARSHLPPIWRLPQHPGIYCVYICRRSKGVPYPHQLIYIGMSVNVRRRVRQHEHKRDWQLCLLEGHELLGYIAARTSDVPETHRRRLGHGATQRDVSGAPVLE